MIKSIFFVFLFLTFSCRMNSGIKSPASNPTPTPTPTPTPEAKSGQVQLYDPHISYDDILLAKKELKEKHSDVHDDVMAFLGADPLPNMEKN